MPPMQENVNINFSNICKNHIASDGYSDDKAHDIYKNNKTTTVVI